VELARKLDLYWGGARGGSLGRGLQALTSMSIGARGEGVATRLSNRLDKGMHRLAKGGSTNGREPYALALALNSQAPPYGEGRGATLMCSPSSVRDGRPVWIRPERTERELYAMDGGTGALTCVWSYRALGGLCRLCKG
jgi:hypothetical protein